MPVKKARKRNGPKQARKAKHGKRHGDNGGIEMRYLLQERLDIAVTHVIRAGHKDGHGIEGKQHAIAQKRGELPQGEALARRHDRKDNCLIHENARRDRPHNTKSHAPAHGKTNGAPQRQAEDLRDRRTRSDHRKCQRTMLGIDQARRHHRCDRPKDGMRGGNHQAGKNQDGKRRRHGREKLPAREQRDHRKEQATQIKARSEHHKRQREQHDAPGIHRDHHARRRFADMK